MPYKLDFEIKDERLIVTVEGFRNVISSQEAWREILKKCEETKVKKLLIVSRLKGKFSLSDAFLISEDMASLFKYSGIKIAYVDNNGESYALNLFNMDIANNRGVTGKVFNDLKKAEAWLAK